MDDYISRQALLRDIEKYHLSDGMFQHWVEVQPSVEAEPVRHGRWIEEPNCMYRCSSCGSHYPSIRGYMDYCYCPSCGALMDERSE